MYRTSLPAQYSYNYTTLRAVGPVETLSACTVQLYIYSPMGRTAFTVPQCLYSTAVLLQRLGPYGL